MNKKNKYSKGDIIIEHSGYVLSFNESHRQANWVAYELTKKEALGTFPRKNNFRVDPEIPEITALPSDYRGTDFDRGHLAPAGDMAWSKEAMEESFYMSNISPQYYSFNRGAWKKLESLSEKHIVEWRWVKGHSGHPGNEHADKLANEAIKENV